MSANLSSRRSTIPSVVSVRIHRLLSATAIITLLIGVTQVASAANTTAIVRTAFAEHCGVCHGEDGYFEGDVNLLALKSEDDFATNPALLEKVIGVLVDRRMPPEGEPELPDSLRSAMIQSLQTVLGDALSTYPFEPTPIRRMNRFQYDNAVVDLLELDRQIFRLNERLMRRRNDYFRPHTGTMPDVVRVSCRPLSKDIDNQRPEGFRGVAAFPQDQRAEHGFDNRADHLSLSPLLMESFLRLSQTIAESPDLNPRECRSWDRVFAPPGQPARAAIEGRYEGESQVRVDQATGGAVSPQNMQGFGSDWSGNAQLFWRGTKSGLELTVSFDVTDAGTGVAFGFTRAPDFGIFDIYLDDQKLGGPVDLYDPRVVFDKRTAIDVGVDEGPHTLKFVCVGKNPLSSRYFFGLDYVDVTGRVPRPDATPQDMEEIEVIRGRLATLLRRAFRRPVDPEVLDRITQFAETQRRSGASFEATMRSAVGAIIGMPDFIYWYETGGGEDGTPGRQKVTDFELASRLSQFFWSSIPDDTLLDLAETGQLSSPDVLGAQIERMMNDKRSGRFCENFPGQWLQLERLVTAIPDQKTYPWFYYSGYRSSMHMMSEPLLLFETVFVEDRSVMDLISPDFSWQSDMLRANYEGHSKGKQEVNVQTFKRVPLEDLRRGGVITNAAVMTMTSTPFRTQPITRGAWVNAVIFNDPPEPPPADVPPLPETDDEELEKLTIRERLAVHRERADCAGCHNRIDPLGFALENYDPTGVWRDKYENGREIDVSGVLFNRHEFHSIVEFKQLIVKEKQRFIRAFVSHLMSYALGRELGPADSPALDAIAAQTISGEDGLRTVLKAIAMSDPFLHKNVSVE